LIKLINFGGNMSVDLQLSKGSFFQSLEKITQEIKKNPNSSKLKLADKFIKSGEASLKEKNVKLLSLDDQEKFAQYTKILNDAKKAVKPPLFSFSQRTVNILKTVTATAVIATASVLNPQETLAIATDPLFYIPTAAVGISLLLGKFFRPKFSNPQVEKTSLPEPKVEEFHESISNEGKTPPPSPVNYQRIDSERNLPVLPPETDSLHQPTGGTREETREEKRPLLTEEAPQKTIVVAQEELSVAVEETSKSNPLPVYDLTLPQSAEKVESKELIPAAKKAVKKRPAPSEEFLKLRAHIFRNLSIFPPKEKSTEEVERAAAPKIIKRPVVNRERKTKTRISGLSFNSEIK